MSDSRRAVIENALAGMLWHEDWLGASSSRGANGHDARKFYISVIDQYSSGPQRADVESARATGVNLLFWNGNDVGWQTLLPENMDGLGPNDRTPLVFHTDTWASANPLTTPGGSIDVGPSSERNAGWRDLGFVNSLEAHEVHIATLPEGPREFAGALHMLAPSAGLLAWSEAAVANSDGPLGIEPGPVKLPETTVSSSGFVVNDSSKTQDGGASGLGTGALFLSSAPPGNPANATDTAAPAPQQLTVNLLAATAAASTSNPIVAENALPGTPSSYWDVPHSNQIEGFTTDFSVNAGQRVDFKINVNGTAAQTLPYKIEIFRLGYYGGDGARLVATLNNSDGTAQPNPIYDSSLGLVDAGNWAVTDSWQVPSTALSGVYLARLQRLDSSGNAIDGAVNQIPFVVRNDGQAADIVLQTSDTTWEAYNAWFGKNGQVGANFYGDFSGTVNHPPVPDPGIGAQDRAYAVSYNRPFITRDGSGPASGPQDYLFGADYAAISWLEQNGYNVTYISGVDSDRLGTSWFKDASGSLIRKAYISVGHDEYWSGAQRANVEAARDAGVNLLFWSGNEVYWRTRLSDSIDGSGTDYRTLVSYKETWANGNPLAQPGDYANIDPSNEWTGTWRDLRFVNSVDANGVHIAVGARLENSLTGQLFLADGTGEFGGALDIPAQYATLRVWRGTAVANSNGSFDIAPGLLGYEWDVVPDDQNRPAGLIKLSETILNWSGILVDQGNTVQPGTATHDLTLYRDDSGALVFGSGTVFWSWGLSNEHDNSPYNAVIADPRLQQFTVNLLADMGIQPGSLQAGLTPATASSDHTPATATLSNLPTQIPALQPITVTGTATDNDGNTATTDGVVALVEVSLDGGATWRPAQGSSSSWSYQWVPVQPGTYTIRARAIDDSLNIPLTASLPSDTVEVTAPTTPATIGLFDPLTAVTGQVFDDNLSVELGTKFQSNQVGTITQLKYYRDATDANDTDVRTGHLWDISGALLASVTFTSAVGAAGWQVATLSSAVAIAANTTYVVSYHTNDNYFAQDFFFTSPFTEPFGVLSSPATDNGVYDYGSTTLFPTSSFRNTNYWTDVTFAPANNGTNSPPVFTSPITFSVPENQTAAATLTASDPNVNALVFAIAGGVDAAAFNINATSGALTFRTAPNFEAPADSGGNNAYDVTVSVSDGIAAPVVQPITVTVTDVNEPPPPAAVSLFDPAVTATGQLFNDNGAVELGTKFQANQAGTITQLKYYRTTTDAGDTDVRAGHLWTSGGTLVASVTFTSAPGAVGWQVATLSSPVAIAANTIYVVSYRTDDNYLAQSDFFNTAFTDPTGILSSPAGGNGVYQYGSTLVFPTFSFENTNYWTDITFAPANAGSNQPPTITSNGGGATAAVSIPESTTAVTAVTATDPNAGQTLAYSIAGGADAQLFTINATTGALAFLTAPNFEAPTDSGGNNVYDVTVQVSDGNGGTDTQGIAVTVQNVVGLTLNGTNQADTLTGTSEPDIINGLDGDDVLQGLGGNDALNGDAGNDTASYSASPAGVTVSLATGLASGGD
ncbi:MAG TPA: N,N-dimethylformamidase beta subunit family domain-containing protein, partial [Pseudolabrys sp.]|nr:N,N-dimethylformamidase beta subunit family domain-containing protein [Pseudolabrys sp.]